MGADTTSTHLIFFIAATIVAVSASGILAGVAMDLSDKLDVRGKAFGEQLTTSIRIANDPGKVPVVDNEFLIYVKNTGQSTLDANLVTLMVNGAACTSLGADVLPDRDTDVWRPGDVVELSCHEDYLEPVDNQVRVVTQNGVYDDMKFRMD
jgi:archaeal flagellar protein FlaG